MGVIYLMSQRIIRDSIILHEAVMPDSDRASSKTGSSLDYPVKLGNDELFLSFLD